MMVLGRGVTLGATASDSMDFSLLTYYVDGLDTCAVDRALRLYA